MGRKLLTEHINVPGIRNLDTYRKHGGYETLKKAMGMKPEDIVEEVKKSGLRGRGGVCRGGRGCLGRHRRPGCSCRMRRHG